MPNLPQRPPVESDEVATLYAQRRADWSIAVDSVRAWLDRTAIDVLDGGDPMRIDTSKSRIKDLDRALDKLNRRIAEDDDTPSDIEKALHDLVGIKVLCKTPRDQRAFFDRIRSTECLGDMSLVGEPKDYAATPKPSGYRACHVTVLVPIPNGRPVRVEIQIKTRLQDAWGELTHEDLYKPGEAAAIRSTPFHAAVGHAMAELLAAVDSLADQVANDLDETLSAGDRAQPDAAPIGPVDLIEADTVRVRVRTSGPRYALAVDAHGQQGLIPAVDVKELLESPQYIDVSDHVHVGDELEVTVEEDGNARWYHPVALPH